MEQTRPCLPGSYRAKDPRPGAPARAFTGHVVSAVRTSVPLPEPRRGTRAPAGHQLWSPGPGAAGAADTRRPGAANPQRRRYLPSRPPGALRYRPCTCWHVPRSLFFIIDLAVKSLASARWGGILGSELLLPSFDLFCSLSTEATPTHSVILNCLQSEAEFKNVLKLSFREALRRTEKAAWSKEVSFLVLL